MPLMCTRQRKESYERGDREAGPSADGHQPKGKLYHLWPVPAMPKSRSGERSEQLMYSAIPGESYQLPRMFVNGGAGLLYRLADSLDDGTGGAAIDKRQYLHLPPVLTHALTTGDRLGMIITTLDQYIR